MEELIALIKTLLPTIENWMWLYVALQIIGTALVIIFIILMFFFMMRKFRS